MKKFLFPLLAVMVMAFATSCENDDPVVIVDGGGQGNVNNPSLTIKTYYFDVYANDWCANSAAGYYYCECSLPALSEDVINSGLVMAYLIDADGYDNPLPYLLPRYNATTDSYYWENVRYDICNGKVTFIIQDSDFYTGAMDFENPYKFKVCIVAER